jgi:putative membrane protein
MMGFGLIFVVLIIGLIAYGMGWRPDFMSRDHHRSGMGNEDRLPLDILRERYARGEISKEEYEEMRRDLD